MNRDRTQIPSIVEDLMRQGLNFSEAKSQVADMYDVSVDCISSWCKNMKPTKLYIEPSVLGITEDQWSKHMEKWN